jgi:GntR family transcriptional regulator/MocR family aminotransferase
VIEDDYDSEFRYEGRPVESLQGLDRSGLVIHAGTFSKSMLAGLRIGFLIVPPHLVRPLTAWKSSWDGGTPMLEQIALAEFIRAGDYERHIRRMRRTYRARRDALHVALRDRFGDRIEIGERQGGLNVLVTFRLPLDDADVVARASAAGIALRSARAYFAHPPDQPTFLVGFAALQEETIRDGIDRLARALEV